MVSLVSHLTSSHLFRATESCEIMMASINIRQPRMQGHPQNTGLQILTTFPEVPMYTLVEKLSCQVTCMKERKRLLLRSSVNSTAVPMGSEKEWARSRIQAIYLTIQEIKCEIEYTQRTGIINQINKSSINFNLLQYNSVWRGLLLFVDSAS